MTRLLRAWRSVRSPAQFAALVTHLAARLGLRGELGRGLPPAERSRLKLVPLVPLVGVLDLDCEAALDVANPYSVLLVHGGGEGEPEQHEEEGGRRGEGSHGKHGLGVEGGRHGGGEAAGAAVLRDLLGTEAARVSMRLRHDMQRYHARATGATAPPPLGRGRVRSQQRPQQQARPVGRGASRRPRCGGGPAAPAAPRGVPAAHGGRPRPQRPPAAAAPAPAAPDGRQMRALLLLRSQQRHAHGGRQAALGSYLWPLACAAFGLLVFGWVVG